MDETTRGSSEGTSRNTGDPRSSAENRKVGRGTGRPRREVEPESGSRSGSGRREGNEIPDGADYAGMSESQILESIFGGFADDVLTKTANADRNLLVKLGRAAGKLVPSSSSLKDYADLIFKVRESLREDGGSTQESAIEQVMRFLNGEKAKMETVQ